jgi:hypothetical protein
MKRISLVVAVILGTVAALFGVTASGATSTLSGCFGHQGVQFGSNNAYECIAKDDDESGALYWQTNNNDHEWNLHPDSGNLTVNAITFPLGQQNPYYGFIAVIDSSEGGCVVQGAGYGQTPTMCANPGQPPKVMDATFQASYNDFAEVMSEEIPDCAWMPNGTAPGATC